jgi:hypothetical protein
MSFGIATWRQRLKFFFADQGQSIGRQSAECFKKNCLPQYDIDGGDCKNYLDFSAGSLEFDNLHSTINRLSTFKRSSEHLATMKRQFADIATQNFPTSRRKQDKNL